MTKQFEKWWLNKYLADGRQIRKVTFQGPPSRVYGQVELLLDDGTKMLAPHGINAYTPRKSDLQVFEDQPKETSFDWLDELKTEYHLQNKTSPQFANDVLQFANLQKLDAHLKAQGFTEETYGCQRQPIFFKLEAYYLKSVWGRKP